jgi:hypothetical protein
MPSRSVAAGLSPPVTLDVALELLRRRGIGVARKRLQEAAAAGAVPSRLQGGRRLVDEADLDTIAAYFRAHPSRPYRKGTSALAFRR